MNKTPQLYRAIAGGFSDNDQTEIHREADKQKTLVWAPE